MPLLKLEYQEIHLDILYCAMGSPIHEFAKEGINAEALSHSFLLDVRNSMADKANAKSFSGW